MKKVEDIKIESDYSTRINLIQSIDIIGYVITVTKPHRTKINTRNKMNREILDTIMLEKNASAWF